MFFAKSSSKFTFYAEKTLQNAIQVVSRLPNRILTIFQKLPRIIVSILVINQPNIQQVIFRKASNVGA